MRSRRPKKKFLRQQACPKPRKPAIELIPISKTQRRLPPTAQRACKTLTEGFTTWNTSHLPFTMRLKMGVITQSSFQMTTRNLNLRYLPLLENLMGSRRTQHQHPGMQQKSCMKLFGMWKRSFLGLSRISFSLTGPIPLRLRGSLYLLSKTLEQRY